MLRKEIHNMLKRDRRVREFRIGEFGVETLVSPL
ncbi:MAG: hypothetical protein IKS44_02770 [Bacteroidales bacterium]|nr:hypothetical protein [Bacteroidales bacterium]